MTPSEFKRKAKSSSKDSDKDSDNDSTKYLSKTSSPKDNPKKKAKGSDKSPDESSTKNSTNPSSPKPNSPQKIHWIRIAVVIFRPETGNYRHWAMELYDSDTSSYTIYEVLDEHPNFVPSVGSEMPEDTDRFKERIVVERVTRENAEGIPDVVKEVVVDNETTEWNCQDYVIEIIDALVAEGIMDESEEYEEARAELNDLFGPME